MGTQAHPFVTAAYCLELSPLKKIWGAAKVTPWLEKPHVFTIWLFTEKSADPWPSSIDPWSSSCWAWKMGNCCWQSEGEGWRVFGTFLLKLSPFGVCGLAGSASEGRSIYQVVLEIQNPFLLYGPASAPSATPPSPRPLMYVLVPRPWGLYCPVVSPHSAPASVNSPFRKWSSNRLFVCNIYFLLGP